MFFSRSLSCYFVAHLVKYPPAIWETWVLSLGWEDPLEKGKATHSSILAWRIAWTKSMGSQRVGHDWATFTFTTCYFTLKTLGLGSVAGIYNQFSCSAMSDSLWPHGLQHARPPCPSPIPGVYSNSCPLSWWCHPTISSSVVPFSSCLQSFPASGSFQMSQLFASDGQSIGVSASASVLPMNS